MNIHKWTSITLIGLVTLSMIGNTERSVLGQQTSSGIGGSATGSVMKSILVKHCVACHGPKKQKANLRLDTLAPDFSGASAETWHDVLNRVSTGEMPPEDGPPIDTPSRRKLLGWIRNNLDRVAGERQGAGVRTVLRRLTKYEYNNTLQDLLGIQLDFARDLPPEPISANGFRNNGASLGISPMQVEYYLKAARYAMSKAIVDGPAPPVFTHRFEKSSGGNARKNGSVTGNRMPPQGRFLATMQQFPREGEFVVRVKAGAAVPEGLGFPRMRLSLGLRADTLSPAKILAETDVTNSENDLQIYEFRGRMEEFPLPGHNPKFPGITVTISNVHDDGLKVTKPKKFKPIVLNAAQKQRVKLAMQENTPSLPIPPNQDQGSKAIAGFLKSTANLQRRIEELRVLSPMHGNQTDLAYRLHDANEAVKHESQLLMELARDELDQDPADFLDRYRKRNRDLLSDRQQVLKRFAAIMPLDRRNRQRAVPEANGPARSTLVVESVEFEGPVFSTWPPATHVRLLPPSEDSDNVRAGKAIESFMTRAFRRPVSKADVEPVLEFYRKTRPVSVSFEEAIRESLAMVLVSPEFLYLTEPGDGPSERLTPHELAVRVSYFLWSTMPDESLGHLARTGSLTDPEVLEKQVRSMIADPRAGRFAANFTDQWLDLSGLDRIAVNPEYYPRFDDRLKPMMRRETQAFFEVILRRDLSALNFLDSDFAVLNEPLAKHYGLTGPNLPRGGEFQFVTLDPAAGRGGLLTQGSFLMINSTGEDSHPIRRAVWLLDRLLGDPPAPPPPDVPELDSELPDFASLPLKRQLELHRSKEACNDCHRAIDPWGVVFESFDAVGLHRDFVLRKVGKKTVKGSVDDSVTLPNGTVVTGVNGIKNYLIENEQDRFSKSLVSKLLSYALGRSLVLQDRSAVETLSREFQENDYRLSDLVVAVVLSETFQTK